MSGTVTFISVRSGIIIHNTSFHPALEEKLLWSPWPSMESATQ